MNDFLRAAALALSATVGIAGLSASAFAAEDEQSLYEAAKAEGGVIWYTSQFTAERAERACATFREKYPGVNCNPVRASGSVTFQRVFQEAQSNAVQADVFSTSDLTDLVQLREGGHLAPYKPADLSAALDVVRNFSEPDGYWTVSNVAPIGIAYNTQLVSEADAPKNWEDLLDPKWKDQVAIAHPGFSGSTNVWAVAMFRKYGWDYFERLEANKPHIGRSIVDGYNLVVSGERKIALAPINGTEEGAKDGRPVKAVYPTDGVLVPPSGSAVLAKAPHPNAARLFVNFMLSREMSQFLADQFRFPLRGDVPKPDGLRDLDDMTIMMVPEGDGSTELEVQKRFRDTFGI